MGLGEDLPGIICLIVEQAHELALGSHGAKDLAMGIDLVDGMTQTFEFLDQVTRERCVPCCPIALELVKPPVGKDDQAEPIAVDQDFLTELSALQTDVLEKISVSANDWMGGGSFLARGMLKSRWIKDVSC